MTTSVSTKKFELTSFGKDGEVIGRTDYATLDEMIEAMVEAREAERGRIKDITERLIDRLGHFGYAWDVEYDDDFHGVEIAFKDTNYPLWTGAVLSAIAEFMGLSSNSDFGWTINHNGVLRIHNRTAL